MQSFYGIYCTNYTEIAICYCLQMDTFLQENSFQWLEDNCWIHAVVFYCFNWNIFNSFLIYSFLLQVSRMMNRAAYNFIWESSITVIIALNTLLRKKMVWVLKRVCVLLHFIRNEEWSKREIWILSNAKFQSILSASTTPPIHKHYALRLTLNTLSDQSSWKQGNIH